jgi:putative Holliday junction resolvase
MHTEKPILAIDYGEKRIGLAISDNKGIIASPLDVLKITKNRGINEILEDILLIVDEYKIKSILIGRPQEFEKTYSKSIKKIDSFAKKLTDITDIPVIFQDESYSTIQAQNMLLSLGQSTRSSREKIDMISATLFLQEFLNSNKKQK